MTERERMEKGLVYDPTDDSLKGEQAELLELQYDYNHSRPSEQSKRDALLKQMFGAIGNGCYIEPPFYANWAGKNVYFGKNVYANFGLTLVDDAKIIVGDYVMFGPHVTIATANHTICPELRERGMQYVRDVVIGKNVWIGAGAVIVPGITIGENSVIGAGSVVTRDIPANVVAVGNPCRVMRAISERDREYFYRDEKIDWENIKL